MLSVKNKAAFKWNAVRIRVRVKVRVRVGVRGKL
jgi:hypothetical protein